MVSNSKVTHLKGRLTSDQRPSQGDLPLWVDFGDHSLKMDGTPSNYILPNEGP